MYNGPSLPAGLALADLSLSPCLEGFKDPLAVPGSGFWSEVQASLDLRMPPEHFRKTLLFFLLKWPKLLLPGWETLARDLR